MVPGADRAPVMLLVAVDQCWLSGSWTVLDSTRRIMQYVDLFSLKTHVMTGRYKHGNSISFRCFIFIFLLPPPPP